MGHRGPEGGARRPDPPHPPPRQAGEELLQLLRNFKRQALHAAMLKLAHPITGQLLEWHAPLPDDLVALNDALRADTQQHGMDFV